MSSPKPKLKTSPPKKQAPSKTLPTKKAGGTLPSLQQAIDKQKARNEEMALAKEEQKAVKEINKGPIKGAR